jgi:hypothetical protein
MLQGDVVSAALVHPNAELASRFFDRLMDLLGVRLGTAPGDYAPA